MEEPDQSAQVRRLERITTQWSRLNDPAHFAVRYAPAVRAYLSVIIRDAADTDDVIQEFLARVVERGFGRARPGRGRFRDYLKAALRNAARTHARRRSRVVMADAVDLTTFPAPSVDEEADRTWRAEWRACLLDRTWAALEHHQKRSPGNLYYTVLRLTTDHPAEDSATLAVRASEITCRPLGPAAFRKQLSRARYRFAALLVREIAGTLSRSTPADVEEELAEFGLLEHVRDFLPPDWRTSGKFIRHRNPN
jgi:Sigma-70 region 2